MAAVDAVRRIQWIQGITIVGMSIEVGTSLFAAWRARSPALLAFGGDSAIELLVGGHCFVEIQFRNLT